MCANKLRRLIVFGLVFVLTFGGGATSAFAWQAAQGTLNEVTSQVKIVEHTQKIYITKTLSGKYPDSDVNKEFAFTLTINDSVKYDFKLKAGQSASYEINKGAKYTVTEEDYTADGYTAKQRVYSGTAEDADIYITYVNVYQSGSGGGGGGGHKTPDPDEPDEPDEPDNPDEPTPGGDGDNTNGGGGGDKTPGTKVPKTGDENMLAIWMLMLLISVGAGIVVVLDGKIRSCDKLSARKK